MRDKLKSSNTIRNFYFLLLFLVGFLWGNNGIYPIYNLSASAAMGKINKGNRPLILSLAEISMPIEKLYHEEGLKEEKAVPENINAQKKGSLPLPQKKNTGGLQISNETDFAFDVDELLSEPLVKYGSDGVKVLIIHTHTSEAYTPTDEYQYTESDSYRTTDENMNVIAVGEVIAEKLRGEGVEVIHDKTAHDSPEYAGSYRRALDTVNKSILENPSIDIVLDIHRDAISDGNGGFYKTEAEVSGERVAQCMVIVGTNEKGLEHESFKENIKYGLRLQKIINEKYPSLARPFNIRGERFNGHCREGAMIIEVGSNGNTLEEALKCGEYVGNCVAELVLSY